MTIALDPRFGKVIALMESTTHAGERASARERAATIAASCGMTFDEAMKAHKAPPATVSHNFFEGFDDFCEKQEPGYKARRAAEKSEKERARLARKAAIIARYGSEEAALAPCAKEEVLRRAVWTWREPCKKPWDRWTAAVDGYRHFLNDLPERVRIAIAEAYPLPRTFGEARAEHNYWRARRDEIEDVLGPSNFGDEGLDLIPGIRRDMIRDLAERDIPVTSLADLHSRFAMYRDLESHDDKIEDALFRDLTEMVAAQRHPANPSTVSEPTETALSENPTVTSPETNRNFRTVQSDPIADMLQANPSRSDRDIARAIGCSPTTVGKVRRSLGLIARVRSVQRRGQMYTLNLLHRWHETRK